MTFTMVARCPRTGALGVVTCTTGRAVGSAVPHAEEGVGAVATQANTNVLHGRRGLELLRRDFEPRVVLESTIALDLHPENRQILMIDCEARTAAYTGEKNTDWKGHVIGESYVAGGNNIVGPEVLDAMIGVFEGFDDLPLQERLIEAADAGEKAGGCNWPDHTAALLVVGVDEELKIFSRPKLDLRVDSSDDPTADLRSLYNVYIEYIRERRENPANLKGYL